MDQIFGFAPRNYGNKGISFVRIVPLNYDENWIGSSEIFHKTAIESGSGPVRNISRNYDDEWNSSLDMF